jgi:hypothetical protein
MFISRVFISINKSARLNSFQQSGRAPLSPLAAEPFPGFLYMSPEVEAIFHGISHFRHGAKARKTGPDANLNSRSIAISTVFSTGVENFGKRPNAHPVSAGASEEFLPAPTENPAGVGEEFLPGSAEKS